MLEFRLLRPPWLFEGTVETSRGVLKPRVLSLELLIICLSMSSSRSLLSARPLFTCGVTLAIFEMDSVL